MEELLSFHGELTSDEYVEYVDAFYREGLKGFGYNWVNFDVINVLYAAAKLIKPTNYLEIGVRRGRSLCTVVRGNPDVNLFAFDMWVENYAGMENPGPEYVNHELQKLGHRGHVQFINGNSQETIPQFFKENPELKFDLITVDGDHSEEGAFEDLQNVIPRLNIGGVIVFDDIAHPSHRYLHDVWHRVLEKFPHLSSFEFVESGYGIAFAIKRGE
ncbi:class I SAM-dependent methyltransferase [Paenibacillus oryzisoli]|uniref:class I SAM-dependent methyltransferase n=1 Tax=Paenibacillus oryzisoli TaxID=1850517 RepID=UPI003D2D811F